MRHLPNILSGIRLVLVGVFVSLFLAGRYLPALSIFVFAFLTDVLDGYLARANGWVTNLGKLLDPLADKLMTLAALVCIYMGKHKPVYLILFLLMAAKEALMVAGGVFMARRSVVAMADCTPWPVDGQFHPSRPRPTSTQPPPSVVMSQYTRIGAIRAGVWTQ